MAAFTLGFLFAAAIGAMCCWHQRAWYRALLMRVAVYIGDATEADLQYLQNLARTS